MSKKNQRRASFAGVWGMGLSRQAFLQQWQAGWCSQIDISRFFATKRGRRLYPKPKYYFRLQSVQLSKNVFMYLQSHTVSNRRKLKGSSEKTRSWKSKIKVWNPSWRQLWTLAALTDCTQTTNKTTPMSWKNGQTSCELLPMFVRK